MGDVRRYTAEEVARLAPATVRDLSGRYWKVSPGAASWTAFGDQGWQPAAAPDGPFEGPPRDEVRLAPISARPPVTAGATAADVVAASVGWTRSLFEGGALTAGAAGSVLVNEFLVDVQGRVWAPGVSSGSWYYHQAGVWNRWSGPPDQATTADPRTPFAAGSPAAMALAGFFAAGYGTVPEPAAAEWKEPA